jgi:hypothetical protein
MCIAVSVLKNTCLILQTYLFSGIYICLYFAKFELILEAEVFVGLETYGFSLKYSKTVRQSAQLFLLFDIKIRCFKHLCILVAVASCRFKHNCSLICISTSDLKTKIWYLRCNLHY